VISGIVIFLSITLNSPHSWDSSMMDCLVIPGKMSPSKGGVNNSLSGRKQEYKINFFGTFHIIRYVFGILLYSCCNLGFD
jgi:hypothetical protein